MQRNELLIWSGAISLAIAIHGALLINLSRDWKLQQYNYPQNSEHLQINFSFIRQPDSTINPDNTPEISEATQKSTPVERQFIETSPEKTTEVTKDSNRNIVEKKSLLSTEITEDPVTEEEKELITKDTAATAISHVSYTDNETELYMQQLLAHIEKHKYYPASARRRGTTGSVTIEVSINQQGYILELDAQSQHAVLSSAARRTIEAAVPLPVLEPYNKSDTHLKFNMAYVLD